MDVTVVTHNATADTLTDADYRDIYDEVRGLDEQTGNYAMSLDKFVNLIVQRCGSSSVSKAFWSKYHRGAADLTRTMRNELRRIVGLSPLPLTVADVAATMHPDALIAQVGDGPADRALLVGSGVDNVTLHVNDGFAVVDEPQESLVTGVTSPSRPRKRYKRPCIPEGLASRCEASGVGYLDLLAMALEVLEEK